MTSWFSADPHFGHRKIIEYSGRPFADLDEMHEVILSRAEAVLRPGDDYWCLGDWAFGRQVGQWALDRILATGARAHLVYGNHDSGGRRPGQIGVGWASQQDYAQVTVEGQQLVLFHYALRTWRSESYGAVHLHGHSHGNLPRLRRSLDVGVDCHDFRPVSLEQVLEMVGPHVGKKK